MAGHSSTSAPRALHRAGLGFTLVEACITVAILALAAAVVVPAIGNVTLAELRQAASQLSGTVKATYDSAALSGQNYRIVFDFSNPAVVKVQEGEASGSSGSPFGGLAGLVMGGALNDDSETPPEVPPPAELIALLGGALGPNGGVGGESDDSLIDSGFSETKHDLKLPTDIKIMDVWIEGMDKPANEGVIYLEFFPNGHTRNAIVHLTDVEQRIYSVKISALTGKTQVFGEYIEVPK